jgi:SAM-dependent methyltransferase
MMDLMDEQREWWKHFFDEDYVKAWSAASVFDHTEEEAAAIVDLLDLPPGAAILDVPCGFGRIAGPLHHRGFRVTGIDISQTQLQLAAQLNPGPDYLLADMRQPPPGPFDGVINVFSSYGYFEEPEQDLAALQAWSQVLRRGGVLLMDLMHRDRLAYLEGRPRKEGPIREEGTIDWVSGVRTVTVTYGNVTKTFRIRLYTATEIVHMLREVGFTHVEAFGGFRRAPVSPDQRLTIRAVKDRHEGDYRLP